MIRINNNFSGANFSYDNESNCTATGEWRVENGQLVSVNINGQYTKDEKVYNFWANQDNTGNVNISGVPSSIISDVADEVALILADVNDIVFPKEAKEEE